MEVSDQNEEFLDFIQKIQFEELKLIKLSLIHIKNHQKYHQLYLYIIGVFDTLNNYL